MKKTIIALMALAGVAAAETLTYDVERTENAVTFDLGEAATPEELTWTALTITTPSNGELGTGNSVIDWSEETGNLKNSWELSFTLDPSRLSNEYLFGTVKGDSGAEGYTLQITSNGKIQLNENKSSKMLAVGSYTAADSAVAITLQFVKFVDNKGEFKSGLFTLTVGNVSASCTIDEVANTIFTKGSNNNVWTNSGNEKLSNISLKYADSVVIPEPTTATLSLLALAGLAARRRRK